MNLLHPFARHRAANAAIVLSLAAAAAMLLATFSIAHNFFVNPFTYDPQRIGVLSSSSAAAPQSLYSFSAGEFRAIRDSGIFEVVSAGRSSSVRYPESDGRPRRSLLVRTLPQALQVSGATPAMGRFLAADDAPGSPVVVISDTVWRERFGAAPDVLGRSLPLDGVPHTIVGVMPPRYHFLGGDLWAPHERDLSSENGHERRYLVNVLLREDLGMDGAVAGLAALSRRLAAAGPAEAYPEGWTIRPHLIVDAVMGGLRPAVRLVVGAAAMLLLVALANVATFLAVRQAASQAATAVRKALGASPWRLLREAFWHNLALSAAAAVLGWAAGRAVFRWIEAMVPAAWVPRELEGHFVYAAPSAGWALVLVPACALLLTLSQWRALARVRVGLAASTRHTAGAGALGAVRWMARAQLAAATLIATLAATVWFGGEQARARPVGFALDGVLKSRVALPPVGGVPAAQLLADLRGRLRTEPGVADAAFVDSLPFQRWYPADARVRAGSSEATAAYRMADEGLAGTLGLDLLAGRFLDADLDRDTSARVAVITADLAERLWNGADPLGRELVLQRPSDVAPESRTVVGVVSPLSWTGQLGAATPSVFVPWTQVVAPSAVGLLVAAPGAPLDATALGRALMAAAPDAAMFEVGSLSGAARESMAALAVAEAVFLVFAGLACALALCGTLLVLRFGLAVRARELAIRSALGATARRLFGGVLGEALRIGVPALVVGLATAWLLSPGLQEWFDGATPWRLAAVVPVLATLLCATLLAGVPPALRAARTAPAASLSAT